MNYYISDIHFGCQNSFDNRSLEHDRIVKENWNRVVTNADNVYILGDIGKIGSNPDTERLIEIIRYCVLAHKHTRIFVCQKVLILHKNYLKKNKGANPNKVGLTPFGYTLL